MGYFPESLMPISFAIIVDNHGAQRKIASFKAPIGIGDIDSGYRTSGGSRYFSLVTQPLNFNVAESLSMVNDLLEKIISLKFNEIKNCL